MEISPAKTYQKQRKVPEEKTNLILLNLTFLRNLIILDIILFDSIEKPNKMVLERKNYIQRLHR